MTSAEVAWCSPIPKFSCFLRLQVAEPRTTSQLTTSSARCFPTTNLREATTLSVRRANGMAFEVALLVETGNKVKSRRVRTAAFAEPEIRNPDNFLRTSDWCIRTAGLNIGRCTWELRQAPET